MRNRMGTGARLSALLPAALAAAAGCGSPGEATADPPWQDPLASVIAPQPDEPALGAVLADDLDLHCFDCTSRTDIKETHLTGSCESGAAGAGDTCGELGNDDCCASPVVAGGTFFRDKVGEAPASITSFRLDRYEVTVGRFRAFVSAGRGTQKSPPPPGEGAHERIPGSGWDPAWNELLAATTSNLINRISGCYAQPPTWTNLPGENEHLPILCVDYYTAFAFCAWDGGRLPTEAEWAYAAAGGDEQRVYPWSRPPESREIDDSHAVFGCRADGDLGVACTLADILPVGSKPLGEGRYGQLDLAGGVAEWVLDWYADEYMTPCADCANLTPAAENVIRGGGHTSDTEDLESAARNLTYPYGRGFNQYGVRCARAL